MHCKMGRKSANMGEARVCIVNAVGEYNALARGLAPPWTPQTPAFGWPFQEDARMAAAKIPTVVIAFRLDETTHTELVQRAENAGLSPSLFAREAVLRALDRPSSRPKRVRADAVELLRLQAELAVQGRLLNQVARSLSSGEAAELVAADVAAIRVSLASSLTAVCDALNVTRQP